MTIAKSSKDTALRQSCARQVGTAGSSSLSCNSIETKATATGSLSAAATAAGDASVWLYAHFAPSLQPDGVLRNLQGVSLFGFLSLGGPEDWRLPLLSLLPPGFLQGPRELLRDSERRFMRAVLSAAGYDA